MLVFEERRKPEYPGKNLSEQQQTKPTYAGTVERISKWGAENERRRREFVGGSGGIPPQKILKSRGSEIVFTAFSTRDFLK